MPAINFQARFADKVKNREKRQTIRANGKRRPPRVGDPLMLYTGMRQCGCRKLLDAVCSRVTPISISTRYKIISVGNTLLGRWQTLTAEEAEELAIKDGFASADELYRWVSANHGDTLSGNLIEWE